MTILITVHPKKIPYSDMNNSLTKVVHIMQFVRKWVTNDQVRHMTALFGGHLGYQTQPILELGQEVDLSNLYMIFDSNQVINDYGILITYAN